MAVIKKGLASLFPGKGGGKGVPPPLPPIGWGPGGGSSCPHPEEEILLADDSWIKAKDIKTGDKVKTLTAKDFKEGEYEITRAEIIDNQPRCEVFFKDSKSIISSYSHPYAVEDKGFVEAQDIKAGDTVGDLIVTATKPLDWGPVVSLSVDKAETYMLKAGSEDKPVAVLSHNKTPIQPTLPPTEPTPPRPPDEVAPRPPWDPAPPRPPTEKNLGFLKRKRQRLLLELKRIEDQIRKLMGDRGRPIRPDIPWQPVPGQPGGGQQPIGPLPPKPIGPPTMPVPIGPGTPVPPPPKPIPPWGG